MNFWILNNDTLDIEKNTLSGKEKINKRFLRFFAVLTDISEIRHWKKQKHKKAYLRFTTYDFCIENIKDCQKILKHGKLIVIEKRVQKKLDICNKGQSTQLLRHVFQHWVKEKTWKKRKVKIINKIK